MNWQLNKIQYPIYNLGPGKRLGIWVQGCDLACKGCLNRTLWSANGGKAIDVLLLANWVLSRASEFEGITITGGEPFQQYPELIAFCAVIQRKSNLDIYCYSGYSIEELTALFPDRLYLQYLDYILDGRYEEALHENLMTRGSSNQKLYHIKNGVAKEIQAIDEPTQWSLNVDSNMQIYMAGIPETGLLEEIEIELLKSDIIRKFK